MKKNNWIKTISLLTTVAGMLVTLASDWVCKKEIESEIEEKVREILAEREKEEEP